MVYFCYNLDGSKKLPLWFIGTAKKPCAFIAAGMTYAITIAALELGLQLGVGLVCLQEPYIDRDFNHPGYLLYWPEGQRRDCRVAIGAQRDLLDQLVIEARIDLISHPYMLTVDIWDLGQAQEKARRTRIVNCYDNWVGASYH
jgi:hypothetical protein